MSAESNRLRKAERCYRWLMLVYPKRFRGEFGEEMLQLFRAQWRESQLDRSALARFGFWLSFCADIGTAASFEHLSQMKERIGMRAKSRSTDIIAWIVAVLATLLLRAVTSDVAVQLAPTLFACGVAGAVWVFFRALSRRLTRGLPARSLSATLAIGSVIGAGVVTLLVIVALDIPAARGVVAVALALAGIGWGLASDMQAFRRSAQIA